MFGLKDAIYIFINVVTVAAIYFRFNNRLYNSERKVKRFESIFWENGGRLNVVDHKTCREFRDIFFESLRKAENNNDRIFQRLELYGVQLTRIEGKIKGDK